MKTPVIGDRAVGYIVDSSGPMGNARVSTLEPTHDESIFTTCIDVMSHESILENLRLKVTCSRWLPSPALQAMTRGILRYAVYNYATMVGL